MATSPTNREPLEWPRPQSTTLSTTSDNSCSKASEDKAPLLTASKPLKTHRQAYNRSRSIVVVGTSATKLGTNLLSSSDNITGSGYFSVGIGTSFFSMLLLSGARSGSSCAFASAATAAATASAAGSAGGAAGSGGAGVGGFSRNAFSASATASLHLCTMSSVPPRRSSRVFGGSPSRKCLYLPLRRNLSMSSCSSSSVLK
mmetsp:Transcript_26156/g.67883  ORF Transcript_26156/g.67883 Transcript_26156/m.67883 type:complete len:201 (+) Transcript_26156:2831-3433(+)